MLHLPVKTSLSPTYHLNTLSPVWPMNCYHGSPQVIFFSFVVWGFLSSMASCPFIILFIYGCCLLCILNITPVPECPTTHVEIINP